MSEKKKITENPYNRFLTSFKLRGPQKCNNEDGQKIVLTKYTLRLSLNLIGLEGLKLSSQDKRQTFCKVN